VPCYSAAIYKGPAESLADAQLNKIGIITQELDLHPDLSTLDIGCGWGVLTRRLAEHGCHVTGITLSQEQLAFCEQARKVPAREMYLRNDYRSFFSRNSARYDRISCIEVLDHIGRQQFDTFFALVNSHLSEDGIFFLQVIVRPDAGQTSAWIQKYIYPGGYIASIDEISMAYKNAGFNAVKVIRLSGGHYAQTLRDWRANLVKHWAGLSSTLGYDETFLRKWLFFLAYSI
jgi:cyclopropane-fatty-acyl-phospholipid synthase